MMLVARRKDEIMHALRLGFHTARLEGANNKIKVIKRLALVIRRWSIYS